MISHSPHLPADLLFWELAQRRESGYDVTALDPRVADALAAEADSTQLLKLLGELEETTRPAHWDDDEPESLEGILSSLPEVPELAPVHEGDLPDRMLGAWLGRCAGNNLGKPVENGDHWTPEHLRRYLELAGSYPLVDYVPLLDPMPAGFDLRENWPLTTRGQITEAARDDDVDYTILGLYLHETYGSGYTRDDVALEWLDRLPYTQTYTAERVAYRNLVLGLTPELAGSSRNPYREWIGALIRADIHGFVRPGDPRAAAALAYGDASLSHTTNGVYGEMWAAALVSAAFVAESAHHALEVSLTCVPPRSRLAVALRDVLDLHARGRTWDDALLEIRSRWGHLSWVHTINNACLIAAGLLWGAGDFTSSIGLTVQGGWDTDSNGATTGSVAGILTGSAALPEHWVAPLNDRARSAIRGYDGSRISDLAARTLRVAVLSPSTIATSTR